MAADRIKYVLALVTAFAVCSCGKDLLERDFPHGGQAGYPAGKVLNTSDDALPGSILFYADSDAVSSGLLDSIAGLFGSGKVEKVFPDVQDVESGAGSTLDRWYCLTFDSDMDLDMAASLVCGAEGVEKVQFNSRLHKTSDCRSYPYYGPATKAAASDRFNDPDLSSQWNYHNVGNIQIAPTARAGADINAMDAWRISGGNPDVIVAVIDEGIQYNHPDLEANMWINEDEIPGDGEDNDNNGYVDDYYGCNFVTGDGTITWRKPGDSGHATHIAGTIAAVNNNGTGVCGIAGGTGNSDGVKVMTCAVFDGMQGGDLATCARAIRYAADNGASVISCSFGFTAGTVTSDSQFDDADGSIESDAIKYFLSKNNCPALTDGNIAVFAAGNDRYRMANYPGAYTGCISVCAIGCDGLPAFYTNYGPGCDISAPGGERYTGGQDKDASCILSTMPTESFPLYDAAGNYNGESSASYGYMQGTSMACPHVSGIVALGLSYALETGRQFTREEFISMLLSSVEGIDSRLEGTKNTLVNLEYGTIGALALSPYRYNMGTGIADAWRLLMQIEGTPCVTVQVGETAEISLDWALGGNSSWIRNCTVSISDEDSASLGLESAPVIEDGMLILHPTRLGSAKIAVEHIAGGDSAESVDSPSGMPVKRYVSVLARENVSENGGWL